MAQLRLQRKIGGSIKKEPNYKLVYYMGNEFANPTEEELRYAIRTGGWSADNFRITSGSNRYQGYYAGYKTNANQIIQFDKSFVFSRLQYRRDRSGTSTDLPVTTLLGDFKSGTSHSSSGISNNFIIDTEYSYNSYGSNISKKGFIIGNNLNVNSSVFYATRQFCYINYSTWPYRQIQDNQKQSNNLQVSVELQRGNASSSSWVSHANSLANLYCIGFVNIDDISGLSAYGSDIATILSNSQQLFSNPSALKWMVNNCTGDFMISALSNSTFVTELNNSANPNTEIVKADEDWARFIALLSV